MPSKTDVLRVKLVADGAGKVKAEMLGVDDSFKRVEKSSSTLSSRIRGLSGVFGVLSAAAIGGAIKSTISFADSIDKAAKAAGVGTEFLQEMRFAADQLGVSNKLVDEGFRRFTRRLGEFVNSGGGPAQKAIEKLGIAVTDTNGKFRGSEAVFEDFALAMQGLESDAERSAFAAQIFGDDAGPKLALLLNQGAEGIRNLRQEAQDIGAVLSDDLIANAVDAQDSLSKLSAVLKVQVTSALIELAPLLTAAANGFVELAKAARSFFGIGLSPLEEYVKQIDVLRDRADRLRALLSSPISTLFGRGAKLQTELDSVNSQILTLQQAIFDLGLLAEDEPLNDFGASAGAEGAAELNSELEKIQNRLNPLQAKAKEYAAELATITGSNLGLQQQAELIQRLDQEFADATGGPKQFKASVKAIEKDIKKVGTSAAEELQKPFDRAAENIQRGFGNTFTEIFRDGEIRFETFTDLLRDMFARLAGEIAALLIFRPAIISSGLGGLGLFGGSAAAGAAGGTAASGGTGAAAGTVGGFLATGAGGNALAAAIAVGAGLAGNFAGQQFSSLVGMNSNAGGNIGGAIGGIGGAALFGPGGAAIGAFLGNLAGSFIGNGFGFGGGNDKVKFGFGTGADGVQTPFGGLSVTASKNIDSAGIIQGLADLDEAIAALLSPGQIEQVRADLSGTGQFFSVKGFDNESFDVVKTRLIRIIDSVAENTVASGLLNSIGRDPGNIDELVASAGQIIELINVFQDDGAELNNAEQALVALNDQFNTLADTADQLGFSIDAVETKRQQAIADLTGDFNSSIRDQILAFENPLTLALENIERVAQERMDNAISLGANLVEVEKLNALERAKVVEQVFGSSNSSITRFLDSLKLTGAGGLSIGQQTANTETRFNELLGSARTDPSARADLAALLPAFLDLKREQLGSTAAFFEFTSFLDSTLNNLVDQGDTVSTLQNIGAAITTGDNAIVDALHDEIGSLRVIIGGMVDDMNLLLNAPTAA